MKINIFSLNNILAFLILIIPSALIFGNIINLILFIIILLYIIIFFLNKIDINYDLNHCLIYLFFIYIFINSLINYIFINSDYNLVIKSFLYLRFLILYLAIEFLVTRSKFFLKYLNLSIIIPVLFVSMDTLLQFYYGKDIFGYESSADRLTGPFHDEHIPGSYLAKFFLIFLYFFLISNIKFNLREKKYYTILFSCVFSFFVIISIILTGERTAFIELILSIALIIIFFFKFSNRYKFLIFIFLTLAISITLLINPKIKERYFDQNLIFFGIETNFSKNNNEVGMDHYNSFLETDWGQHYITAYNIWKNNKIFGSGYDSFKINCQKDEFKKYGERRCSTHPHHYYLEFLSEQGLIGFLLFLCLLIVALNIHKMSKNSLSLILLFSILIFFFPIKPNGSFFNTWISSIFWFIFSLLNISNAIYLRSK